jgi:hypothetical protein
MAGGVCLVVRRLHRIGMLGGAGVAARQSITIAGDSGPAVAKSLLNASRAAPQT